MYNVTKNFSAGLYRAYGVNAVYFEECRDKTLLVASFFDRSRVLCKAMVASIAEGQSVQFQYQRLKTKGSKYRAVYKVVNMGRDRFIYTTVVNREVGTKYLMTDVNNIDHDLYNFLMTNFHLPLKEEWMPQVKEYLALNDLMVASSYGRASMKLRYMADVNIDALPGITLHGRDIRLEDVRVFNMEYLTEQNLTLAVSTLIKEGSIKVCDVPSKPLVFDSFDSYITKYGPSLVKNLEQTIETLSPLKGDLDGFVAKTKRLYPQQGACVNGIIALKKADSQYGLMVEGMGCGKTLQGASVVDAYFNQKWLEKNPGKDMRDLYMSDDQPKYRNILMAPSHLVAKWKEEITSEIPGATVEIINDLDQLVDIREQGKARTGRQWYLISKDFAKLGSQSSPIPTNMGYQIPMGVICKDCYEEDGTVVFKKLHKGERDTCEKCTGHNWMKFPMREYGKVRGMVCPECGELLIRYSAKYNEPKDDDKGSIALRPEDFASRNSTNETCFVCGAHLWGVDCKPVGGEPKPRKWKKVSHWKNFQKKNRTTAWVLKGHENEYFYAAQAVTEDLKESPVQYGPRRFAPSIFIKKYLKGYFDFCVLDEAHKYESGGSAQSVAAHALMKASGFTLCLTGTISNGKADSFFYLLYMLDPRRMRKLGYEYKDVMDFSRTYGAVETLYEAGSDQDGKRNSCSRGRQLSAPRVKPGISPKLFTDFLLDKSVFLDLSDLSKYLPQLKESVITCECPDDVKREYETVMNNLKDGIREKGGRTLLSTMLQFGLSYPDKPYGRGPIMHPFFKDQLVSNVPEVGSYKQGQLLPKEEKLIELVNSEIGEDRNVFIYCAYTGNEEMNITGRLKSLVEKHCNLEGSVLIMEAASPKATEREAFIKQKASEGIRVFICNMKLVETGLDFCFDYEGASYNYPTIIFYQLTYELSVMWQASRRHYRLNQTQECRTYYLVTEGTLQMAACQIMAEKQVAASAIQGKFSADGLVAMANGVDPRVKLAQMLASNDDGMGRESLENMFDVMNASNTGSDDETRYGDYTPPQTYYELMEGLLGNEVTETKTVVTVEPKQAKVAEKPKKKATKPATTEGQMSFFDSEDLSALLAPCVINKDMLEAERVLAESTKKKTKKQAEGQLDLFSMFAA